MPVYVVEIINTNAVSPSTSCGGVTLTANPSRTTNRGLVHFEGTDGPGPVALFESREQAHAVGLACRYNNQRFEVKTARGKARENGQTVDASLLTWEPPY